MNTLNQLFFVPVSRLLPLIGLVVICYNSSAQTTSTTNNPDWDSSGDWTGSAPGFDTNRSLILNNNSDISGNPLQINSGHTVTINAGVTLTTDESLTVKEGGTLIVNGTITGLGSEIKIEKGTLLINPDGVINWNGGGIWTSDDDPATINIHGVVCVSGDLSNKVTIDGTGTLKVSGTLNNDGGSIFGCTLQGAQCCTAPGCTIGTSLPVELLYFEAAYKDKLVFMEWSTASEINNDYFNIERAQADLDWKTIATISGSGDSNVKLSYEFVDENPPLGLVYYRLKQTDYDGTFEYPGITSIYSDSESLEQIYPNPTRRNFSVSLLDASQAQFSLRNIQGQSIDVPKLIKFDKVEFYTSNLRRGIYFLTIQIGSETTTSKILLE